VYYQLYIGVDYTVQKNNILCGVPSVLQKLWQLDLGPVSYSKVLFLGFSYIGILTKVIDF